MAPMTSTTPMRQRNRAVPYMPSYMENGQTCVVCGDLATGLHYRAITCEGCKGFFRRTSQRHLSYTCKSDEKCEINKQTRNVCQRCRYIKCVAVGMSAELVLNDDERVQKRALIKGNRERRHLEQLLTIIKGPPLSEERQKELVMEVDLITNAYCRNIDQPIDTTQRAIGQAPDSQLLKILRLIVRRSSEFAQVVGVWNTLPVECQTQLLHSSMLDVHLLRFASFFDDAEDSFRPAANVSLSHKDLLETLAVDVVDDEMDELRELLTCLFSLARSLAELQMDDRLFAVLSAMFIFDPTNVSDSSQVEAVSFAYARLDEMLHALIDEASDGIGSTRAFAKLLHTVTTFGRVCRRLAQHFKPENVEFFEKILGF